MRPELEVGDIVIIQEIPVEEIQKGDIIQYFDPDMPIPVVHRVHEITMEENNKFYITKGDANSDPDSDPIVSDQIMGKSVFTLPKIGWIPIAIKEFLYQIKLTLS
jgi:signal peptidase